MIVTTQIHSPSKLNKLTYCNKCNNKRKLHIVVFDDKSQQLCDSCISDIEKKRIAISGIAYLYIYWDIVDGKHVPTHVSNWLNSPDMKFKIHEWAKGNHNIGHIRYDVWFKFDGNIWWGVNVGNNDIVRCKRTKRKA